MFTGFICIACTNLLCQLDIFFSVDRFQWKLFIAYAGSFTEIRENTSKSTETMLFKPLCPYNQKKSLFWEDQNVRKTVIITPATQALGTFQKSLRLPFGFLLFSIGTSHFVPVPLYTPSELL